MKKLVFIILTLIIADYAASAQNNMLQWVDRRLRPDRSIIRKDMLRLKLNQPNARRADCASPTEKKKMRKKRSKARRNDS